MITPDQATFYKDNGYLLLPGLLDKATLDMMRAEADATIARMNDAHMDTNRLWGGKWINDEARKKQRIDAVHDMQFQAGVFSLLLTHKDLLDAMEALIGPNVQLHHTKLLAKPAAKGGAFPMHQDYPYFPHEKHSMLAVSIYLDDADEENGCIRVVPGSHKLGPLPCDPGGFYLPPDKYPVEDALAAPAKAGDGLAFNYLTIHGSGPNTSARPRRNILIQMRDAADRPTTETHASRGQGMMLRGINPYPLGDAWQEQKKEAVKA